MLHTMLSMIDIKKALPHAYPFLLVDKVVALDTDRILAIKNVSHNEQYFQGHFPDNPVMPGVLIIESMLQTGGLLASTVSNPGSHIMHVVSVDKVRFKQVVVPGDQLHIEVKLVAKLNELYKFSGVVYVDDQVVTEANWMGVFKN